MTLRHKQWIIAALGGIFLLSLVFVQAMEVARRKEEAGLAEHAVATPANSKHKGVGCVECHLADEGDADAFDHKGVIIATVVTPRDCKRCHQIEAEEFQRSHHARGGNILASLDNFLAETVEGFRGTFSPHSPTPGGGPEMVEGFASATLGCKQCHGSLVALQGTDGPITFKDLVPDPETGQPTNRDAMSKIVKDENGKPKFDQRTWPNTGIGRLNLDGSKGSCSACHSRHDFSPRRARRPENCGKCHLGPDHPQKEIYEESKHGAAYRDLKEKMNLDSTDWVLGKDYSQAPTCATCHMSGHTRNDGRVTHDPGERISWTNRPPISLRMDTDINHKVIKEKDPDAREKLVHDGWGKKRQRMSAVCSHCHTPDYINGFYKQYDDFVVLYNEKFAKPGTKIMAELLKQKIRTKAQFDDEIEWTWFYLWHHEGRRARHGASMMAPDYAHWHGMYEVAERFYVELIPQAREMAHEAREHGNAAGADAVEKVVDAILARPEHQWFEKEKKR
jgi:hypothetical protein